jgi:predicted methyltransferase
LALRFDVMAAMLRRFFQSGCRSFSQPVASVARRQMRSSMRPWPASEVNANPKDTKDYPEGVWTLPPTYALKDQDRDEYSAIGESGRFVVKLKKTGAK